MDTVNGPGVSYAHSLIGRGAVDKTSGWSFSAEDGNKLLGPDGKDWNRYGECHLALNPQANRETREHYAYPFVKETGGALKVYRSALIAIRQRAAQQSATSIYDAAGRLLELIDGKRQSAASHASAEPASFRTSGTVTIAAAGDDTMVQQPAEAPKRPTFQIHAYTGAPMAIDGFVHPVVVDLNGIRPPSPTLPALRQHDPNRIVGQTLATRISASGVDMGIHMGGIVTGDDKDAHDVVHHAKNGFKWQASIGADIERREFLDSGKKAMVNGREVTGPMHIVRAATLKEVSFVPIGADGATSAAVAASGSSGPSLRGVMSLFDTWLQVKGFDPLAVTAEQRASLRAMYERATHHV